MNKLKKMPIPENLVSLLFTSKTRRCVTTTKRKGKVGVHFLAVYLFEIFGNT